MDNSSRVLMLPCLFHEDFSKDSLSEEREDTQIQYMVQCLGGSYGREQLRAETEFLDAMPDEADVGPLGFEEQAFTFTESVFVGVGQCPQMPGDMAVDNLLMRKAGR